jgi:putative glycosyltransferase (TIGR04372 family)
LKKKIILIIIRYKIFLFDQSKQINQNGFYILIPKIKYVIKKVLNKIFIFLMNILFLPIVLLLISIKPICHFRFGLLMNTRIGHLSPDTEAYYLEKKISKNKTIDIISSFSPYANEFLVKKWSLLFKIYPFPYLIKFIDNACLFWLRNDTFHVKLYDRGSEYHKFMQNKPSISFSNQEILYGNELLEKIGFPVNAKFVCIHNRDTSYMDKTQGGRWKYHDFRNYDIDSLISSTYALIELGFYVIRVGSIVEKKMLINNNNFFDYSNSDYRSDFLDIFLHYKSEFLLGNDSGLWTIPLLFRKPILMTNFTDLSNFFFKDYKPWFIILKRHWSIDKNRYLNLNEIFDFGLETASSTKQFEINNVILISNTEEEIKDFVLECIDRINNKWEDNVEDLISHKKFWSIIEERAKKPLLGGKNVIIGTRFLRNHKDLLN